MRPRHLAAALLATVVLGACGGSDPESAPSRDSSQPTAPATIGAPGNGADPTTGPTATDAAATNPAATDPAASDPAAARPTAPSTEAVQPATSSPAIELSAWQTLPITDVDGTTFTLADLVGKPVLVETFATWCSKCRAQLGDTNQAAAEIGDAAHVLALSVETDLDAGAVADYAIDQGFDNIRFAVMSPELLAALVDAYGNTVANPPTTPKIVVDAAGRAGDLTTGFESPDDLVAQVAAAG